VSDKMKSLLKIAKLVQISGKAVTPEAVANAKENGASDEEIHDTVLIAGLFCLYNRYVDGLASVTPANPEFYQYLGERIVNHGYNRLPQGYDHLKK
ncbi:MAG: carboxymuconolactone decarboxylase, partial [Dyadobacter sp.]